MVSAVLAKFYGFVQVVSYLHSLFRIYSYNPVELYNVKRVSVSENQILKHGTMTLFHNTMLAISLIVLLKFNNKWITF